MNWAFRQFAQKTLIKAGKNVAQAEVWLGETNFVGLEIADDISALIPYSARDDIKVFVTYEGPIQAPIKKGEELGALSVDIPGIPPRSYPVYASSDVAAGGIMKRIRASINKLLESIS
jgi:D-alanyl-D-alanine carboxypeptidase (penicillin-binding protein 5/6)